MARRDGHFERAMAGCRRPMLYVGVFSCFANLLMLTLPIYMMQVFDRVVVAGSKPTLWGLTLIAIFALSVWGALEYWRNAILAVTSRWVEQSLGPELFGRALAASLGSRANHAGFLGDLQQVRGFLSSNVPPMLFDAPWAPIYILVIWLIHWSVGLLAAIAAGTILALAFLNQSLVGGLQREANESGRSSRELAEATARNAEAIRAMGMTRTLVGRWGESQDKCLEDNETAALRSRLMVAIAKAWRFIVQLLALGVGAYFVLEGELGPGGMIAGSILMGRALAPIEGAVDAWRQVVAYRQSRQRLEQFFAETEDRSMERDGFRLPRPNGRIVAQDVYFVYPGSQEKVLRAVSFDLPGGEVMAIIGDSAAGKSTLLRVIAGVYAPNHGSVRLDQAEVSSWRREDLGPHIGYLPQTVELFRGTVAENIARMAKDPPNEAVLAAAHLAGAHETILNLPMGYDTPIVDGGANLSGGQRQRIGLARALYGEPALVLLDEANANLDQRGDDALNRAIGETKERGATVVLVTHRKQMLAHVDRILVMKEGMVALYDERAVVLAQLNQLRVVATGGDGGRRITQAS